MAKGIWQAPGKITEPAGKQLGAFGVDSLPGARINMVDPVKRKSHPGFAAVQRGIASTVTPMAGETPMQAAGAILAASSRGASAIAKAKNPRLKKVRGM